MRKALCLILKHRFRVVQEFGPSQRRLKCERCGGDWSLVDQDLYFDWDSEIEQLYRDLGYELLEPLEPIAPEMEPLTLPEWCRACRWPGAFAMALGFTAGCAVEAAGLGLAVRLAVSFVISYAIMRLLMPGVYRRTYERKCGSLQA